VKLIMKKDLKVVDGFIVTTDGTVLSMPRLLDECNEIVDLGELISFVLANDAKITAAATSAPVEFEPASKSTPKLEVGTPKPSTPLIDEFTEAAKARAEEFLNVQQYGDVNAHLARYPAIATWLENDYVLAGDQELARLGQFKIDPFEITAASVIETVTLYHDPKVRKLIAGVVINR
jgi:hypothetical protein